MDKRVLEKILFIAFLAVVILVSSIELKNNLQNIKGLSIKNHAIHSHINKKISPQKEVIYDKEIVALDKLMHPGMVKEEVGPWKAIERKDSYNNELQYYSKSNVVIKDDTIEITSRKEFKEDKKYTSGLVESTSAYKYGYFEFTIEISKGKGLFPAIWFLPAEGGALPEIDLFEMIGNKPYTFYGVIHYIDDGIQGSDYFKKEVAIKENYSVSLEWTADSLTWYIDDEKVYSSAKGLPKEYMFIVINQAIGGNWPGNPDDNTIFPNQFKILSTQIEPVFMKGRD